jgi:hypothetical protein
VDARRVDIPRCVARAQVSIVAGSRPPGGAGGAPGARDARGRSRVADGADRHRPRRRARARPSRGEGRRALCRNRARIGDGGGAPNAGRDRAGHTAMAGRGRCRTAGHDEHRRAAIRLTPPPRVEVDRGQGVHRRVRRCRGRLLHPPGDRRRVREAARRERRSHTGAAAHGCAHEHLHPAPRPPTRRLEPLAGRVRHRPPDIRLRARRPVRDRRRRSRVTRDLAPRRVRCVRVERAGRREQRGARPSTERCWCSTRPASRPAAGCPPASAGCTTSTGGSTAAAPTSATVSRFAGITITSRTRSDGTSNAIRRPVSSNGSTPTDVRPASPNRAADPNRSG